MHWESRLGVTPREVLHSRQQLLRLRGWAWEASKEDLRREPIPSGGGECCGPLHWGGGAPGFQQLSPQSQASGTWAPAVRVSRPALPFTTSGGTPSAVSGRDPLRAVRRREGAAAKPSARSLLATLALLDVA